MYGVLKKTSMNVINSSCDPCERTPDAYLMQNGQNERGDVESTKLTLKQKSRIR